MPRQETSVGFFSKIWDFFASVRLTIVLLLTLAATSIIGTLIPQNEDPAAYFKAFGQFFYRLFNILGLYDMYHSWWFQTLLILLTTNIIICSLDRLSANRRILFIRHPSFRLSRFRSIKNKAEFTVDEDPEQLQATCSNFVSRRFGHHMLEKTGNGFAVFGEKGRWTRFGVYAVHLSVVILLIGGLVGSIFGFDGFVNIAEGESARVIHLRNTHKTVTLDFAIRCDDFNVSFYETGAPKEYRSSLTILEKGREVIKKDIIVNDPLRYRGISLYQSSYGKIAPDGAILGFTSRKTGMIYRRKAVIGQTVVLPEKLGTFVLKEFRHAADFKGHNIGEAFVGALTRDKDPAMQIVLPLRFPSFDKMRRGEVFIAVIDPLARYYTGLQVNKDPGVGIVYAGFILMIVGCYVTFFMSHQQICIEVDKGDKATRVTVAGTANKNKLGMQVRIAKIAQRLGSQARQA